jgi:outer membrane autotransporter protein
VRSALRQLAPTAYDHAARASLNTGRALSGILLGERFREDAASDAFVLPVTGYAGQDRWRDNLGFDAYFAGLMGGFNRHVEKGRVGLHVALIHSNISTRSTATTRSRGSGIHLGAHGSLFPHQGFFISGLANIGLEHVDMTRTVEINDYQRRNSASYTAFMASSTARAGYEWQAGDFRFGPLAGLDYGFYRRPSVSETGGQATRLKLNATHFHSLRSALGGQVTIRTNLANHLELQAGLSAQWMHELLDTRHGSKAAFAGYNENSFSVKHRTDDRNALALNASVMFVSRKNLDLNVHVGTELFRTGGNSVQGGLSVGWRF